MGFKLMSDFVPQGDQPQAIDALTEGLENGERHQTLVGVTVRERPLPWPILFSDFNVLHWFLLIIKPLLPSCAVNLSSFFLIMLLSIL